MSVQIFEKLGKKMTMKKVKMLFKNFPLRFMEKKLFFNASGSQLFPTKKSEWIHKLILIKQVPRISQKKL